MLRLKHRSEFLRQDQLVLDRLSRNCLGISMKEVDWIRNISKDGRGSSCNNHTQKGTARVWLGMDASTVRYRKEVSNLPSSDELCG